MAIDTVQKSPIQYFLKLSLRIFLLIAFRLTTTASDEQQVRSCYSCFPSILCLLPADIPAFSKPRHRLGHECASNALEKSRSISKMLVYLSSRPISLFKKNLSF